MWHFKWYLEHNYPTMGNTNGRCLRHSSAVILVLVLVCAFCCSSSMSLPEPTHSFLDSKFSYFVLCWFNRMFLETNGNSFHNEMLFVKCSFVLVENTNAINSCIQIFTVSKIDFCIITALTDEKKLNSIISILVKYFYHILVIEQDVSI